MQTHTRYARKHTHPCPLADASILMRARLLVQAYSFVPDCWCKHTHVRLLVQAYSCPLASASILQHTPPPHTYTKHIQQSPPAQAALKARKQALQHCMAINHYQQQHTAPPFSPVGLQTAATARVQLPPGLAQEGACPAHPPHPYY
jgi:hypothetical protein